MGGYPGQSVFWARHHSAWACSYSQVSLIHFRNSIGEQFALRIDGSVDG
jgi:hypothetical protein